jgi:hypothetical protein
VCKFNPCVGIGGCFKHEGCGIFSRGLKKVQDFHILRSKGAAGGIIFCSLVLDRFAWHGCGC